MSHHDALYLSGYLSIYISINVHIVYMFGKGYFVLSFIHEAISIYFFFAAD